MPCHVTPFNRPLVESFIPSMLLPHILALQMPFLVYLHLALLSSSLRYRFNHPGASTLQVFDLSLSASRLRTGSPIDLNLETFNPVMN
jgi:hypothetical protein